MMTLRDLLIGIIVVTVWGLNFIAIKLGLREVPPILLVVLRFLMVTFPVIFFLPRPPIAWAWLISMSLAINVGQFAFLFLGMKVGMPAGLASLVLQSQAFFTLFVAVIWLGEQWRWNHLAGLFVAACGIAIIGSQQGGEMTAAGFGLIIASAVCWGTGNVIMRQATQGVPAFSMLSLVVWIGAIAIIPLTALSWFFEGYEAWRTAYHAFTWVGAGSVAYVAFFATIVGYGLWGNLISRYPASIISPLALLVPIVGLSSTALLLGESLSLWQCLGTVLVMIGLVIHVFGSNKCMSRPKALQ